MNPLEFDVLMQTRQRLLAAGHGEKAAVVAQACERLGIKPQALYKKIKALALEGTAALREGRNDKGECAYTPEQLELVSGMLVESTRRNGKQLLPVDLAVSMAHASGKLPTVLSASHVGALLRTAGLHPKQLNHAEPAQSLRTLHPNHLWQVDASVCVLYYLRDGRVGTMPAMPAQDYYKNKPHNLAAVVDKLCARYAMTDHTSGTVWVRYYTGGETAENLIEFFMWCVSQRGGCPAHGVPHMLMMDPGSANKSHLFLQLLKRLLVKPIINEAGNPRAKGQVENAHNMVERQFESRLRFMTGFNLDMLNKLCERWQVAFNAEKKHTRHGTARYHNWMRITAEQLRIAPPMALMRELVVSQEETRRVSNNMTISFAPKGHASRDYDVRYLPGVMAGQQVNAQVNAYRAPAIDVRYTDAETGEICWLTLEPLVRDANGFVQSAPVVGERYARPPLTVADRARQASGRRAYGVDDDLAVAKARRVNAQAFAAEIDPMADVDAVAVPSFLAKRGTALELEKQAAVLELLSVAAACTRLKSMLGAAYPPTMYGWLTAKYGDAGVPAAQLEAVAATVALPAAPAPEAFAPLRAVGGA